MSEWLKNNEKIWKKIVKPCKMCGFCPYGQLVEEFPLTNDKDIACQVFGHDCPVFYQAEIFGEDEEATDEEIDAMYSEFKEILGE